MNGVHDMGGMECYGPVDPDQDTAYHHDWEKQVLALTLAMGATGTWNLDQSRFARESLEPSLYLSIGYYRVWLTALENLLKQHELVTADELEQGRALGTSARLTRLLTANDVPGVLARGAPVSRPATTLARFAVGDQVRVRNIQPSTHTRLPAYLRHHTGTIHRVHAPHVYPDSHANGLGEDPQWLYNVRFCADHLWGEARSNHRYVHADCWEPYLIGTADE